MYDVTFYLKSGQSFTVVLEEITIKHNGLGVVGLEWTGASETLPNLKSIQVGDVSAIVAVKHAE